MFRSQTNKSLEIFRAYKRGIIIGTGIVTTMSATLYCFWPKIQNMITHTTQKVLSQNEIQTTASSLTNNVLGDDKTYQNVCELVNRVLKTDLVRETATELVIDVIRKPEVKEELKQLLISIYQDPEVIEQTSKFAGTVVQSETIQTEVHNTVNRTLADTILRKHASETLKDVVYGMFRS